MLHHVYVERGRVFNIALLTLLLTLINAIVLVILGPTLTTLLGFFPYESRALYQVFPHVPVPQAFSFWIEPRSLATLAAMASVSLAFLGLARSWCCHLLLDQQYLLVLKVGHRYRHSCFKAMLSLDYSVLQSRSVSAWTTTVVHDIHSLSERSGELLKNLLSESALILGIFISLLLTRPSSAVIVAVLVVLVVLYGFASGRWMMGYSARQRQVVGAMSSLAHYLGQHFSLIKVSRGEPVMLRAWNQRVDRYFSLWGRTLWVRALLKPSLELFSMSSLALIIYLYLSWDSLGWNPQSLLQIFLSLAVMMRPLKVLGDQLAALGDFWGILASSLELFRCDAQGGHSNSMLGNDETGMPDSAIKKVVPRASESATLPSPMKKPLVKARQENSQIIHGATETADKNSWWIYGLKIGFPRTSYCGAAQKKTMSSADAATVISVPSFPLNRGRLGAVVGVSGSGKSLLFKTLAGLYPPYEVEGVEGFTEQSLKTGYVPQLPCLFSGTVRENLCYPDVQISHREVMAHLKGVGLIASDHEADEFLKRQIYSQEQLSLSPGQLQRIVIVREMLSQCSWLLFDEASSALSPEDERITLEYLKKYCRDHNCGALWVTHRWEGVARCDEVLACEGDGSWRYYDHGFKGDQARALVLSLGLSEIDDQGKPSEMTRADTVLVISDRPPQDSADHVGER